MKDGLDHACRSIETIVGAINEMVDGGQIEKMMPLVEMLNTQSLLVYHDYLLMSAELAESGDDFEGFPQ